MFSNNRVRSLPSKCFHLPAVAIVLLTLAASQREVSSANISVFCLMGSASHKVLFYPIIEELTSRGHHVTFVTLFPTPKQQIQNATEIVLHKSYEKYLKHKMNFFTKEGPVPIITQMLGDATQFMLDTWAHTCKELRGFRNKYHNKEFDVALVDATFQDWVLPIAQESSKYVILVNPGELFSELAWRYSVPIPFSYVPNVYYAPVTAKMTFLERVVNTFSYLFIVGLHKYHFTPLMNKIIKEAIPEIKTEVTEVQDNVSLVLVNRHVALNGAFPSMPFIKEIGGITVKKSKPLPKDLEKFVSESGPDGFIYISFGSLVDEDTMPTYAYNAFVEAFSRIPQRVIWKFKGQIPDLPSNVKLVDWVPQQDILAHPKIRAFITHGGLFSLMEILYHGVPVIGFPVTLDQPSNIKLASELGIGYELSWYNTNADDVVQALDTVITNKSYKESIMRHRQLFLDNLRDPAEVAAYWVEYVIRHNGARHLRSAANNLNFVQYFLLDVLALLTTVLIVVLYILVKIVKVIVACLTKSKTEKRKQKTS